MDRWDVPTELEKRRGGKPVLPNCPDSNIQTIEGVMGISGYTLGLLFFPVLSAPPQFWRPGGGEMFGCGRNNAHSQLATQNPPH